MSVFPKPGSGEDAFGCLDCAGETDPEDSDIPDCGNVPHSGVFDSEGLERRFSTPKPEPTAHDIVDPIDRKTDKISIPKAVEIRDIDNVAAFISVVATNGIYYSVRKLKPWLSESTCAAKRACIAVFRQYRAPETPWFILYVEHSQSNTRKRRRQTSRIDRNPPVYTCRVFEGCDSTKNRGHDVIVSG